MAQESSTAPPARAATPTTMTPPMTNPSFMPTWEPQLVGLKARRREEREKRFAVLVIKVALVVSISGLLVQWVIIDQIFNF